MAFYKDEFIGCRTGDVKTYAQMKEEAEQMLGKFGAMFTGEHNKKIVHGKYKVKISSSWNEK